MFRLCTVAVGSAVLTSNVTGYAAAAPGPVPEAGRRTDVCCDDRKSVWSYWNDHPPAITPRLPAAVSITYSVQVPSSVTGDAGK